MHTMASRDAQNRFDELLNTSQHEPVLITHNGLPVSLVLSPAYDVSALQRQFARALSELAPLRGAAAQMQLRQTLDSMGTQAEQEGLTEHDIQRMIDEN